MTNIYGLSFDENSFPILRNSFWSSVMTKYNYIADQVNYYPVYINNGNIINLFKNAETDFAKLTNPIIVEILEDLQRFRIYNYDQNKVLKIYHEYCGAYFSVLQDYSITYFDITDQMEKAEQIRKFKKETRGRLVGGGFGLSSALKGIVIAGSINTIIGSFYSIENAIGNILSNIDIKSQLSNWYNNESTWKSLKEAIHIDCLCGIKTLEYILCKELGEAWKNHFTSDTNQTARAILNNLENGKVPESEVNKVLVNCIINIAPYMKELFIYAYNKYGDDNGNLLELAKLFLNTEAEEYIKKENRFKEYQRNCYINSRKFFKDNYDKAMYFLDDGFNDIYSTVEDKLSSDFNKVIEILKNYKIHKDRNGNPIDDFLHRKTNKYIIFFEYDIMDEKERKIAIEKYIKLCNAKISDNEKVLMFADTNSFANRSEGYLITTKGIYPSFTYGGMFNQSNDPIYYKHITKIKCSYWTPEIYYDGQPLKNLKSIGGEKQPVELLQFVCAYYKYGYF